MKVVRGLVAGAVLAMAGTASAASLEGTVYVDDNGDGVLSATDTAVADVVVSYRGTLFTTTDADGHYVLEIPDGDGIVWASVPDGYVVGPLWQKVSAQGDVIVTADLALTRSEHTGPLSFVVGSDSHFGAKGVDSDALTRAMAQLDLSPPANFVTIVGDITQANHPDQFDEVTAAAATLSAPFVPVAGNHDWYDGGASYREHLGPDHYSFNAQGVHFLVMNHNAPLSSWETFLANDLSFVPDDTILVAFTHAPPTDPYRDLLIASGIDYLFTGHWHTNLVFDHGSMLEYNTQTLVMGGIDFSPAGFRVVTFQDGVPVVTHHTIVEHPVTSVVFPRKDACVDGQPFTVIAAAELGAAAASVTARIDGGDAIDLSATGGWTYSAKAPILSPGMHQLTIHATSATGGDGTAERTFSVCEEPPTGDFTVADWTQHQGGPRHHGFSSHAITTPLSLLWTRTVGGHIQGGSVAVADGVVYVPVADFTDGTRGGVVALDARTGETLWEFRSGYAVRNTPAVAAGLVVATSTEGSVFAVDATTGELAWAIDLGDGFSDLVSALYAAPTIEGDRVYVGTQVNFVAIDLATGTPMWSTNPSPQAAWLGSYASAGVADGVVIGAFSRGVDGVVGWSSDDGHELWRVPRPLATAINAAPVIAGDVAYLGNTSTTMFAVNLESGTTVWQRKLSDLGTAWGYGIPATPAYADNTLVVPTQFEFLYAIDATTGEERWRIGADEANVHPAHYQSRAKTFSASPVIAGDTVWAASSAGTLYAIDLDSGMPEWKMDFAAPILSGVVPAGDLLLVSTFDGTVHALVHREEADPGQVHPPMFASAAGCGCRVGAAAGHSQSVLEGAAVLFFLIAGAGFGMRRRLR